MAKRFSIELLDIPYLAAPSLGAISVAATAERINKFRSGGSENKWAYDPAFDRFARFMSGEQIESLLEEMGGFKRKVQRLSCCEVLSLLCDHLAGPRRLWLPYKRRPFELPGGFFFTGVGRGILRQDDGDFSVFVNQRKTMPRDPLAGAFFSRGTFEAHIRDEPSLAGGIVLDLSSLRSSGPRSPRKFVIGPENMMSLDQFDYICRVFFEAAVSSGYLVEAPTERHFGDLFRRASRL